MKICVKEKRIVQAGGPSLMLNVTEVEQSKEVTLRFSMKNALWN